MPDQESIVLEVDPRSVLTAIKQANQAVEGAYTPGDDLRHVDWNVFARTERAYFKRYRGETNSQVLAVLRQARVVRAKKAA